MKTTTLSQKNGITIISRITPKSGKFIWAIIIEDLPCHMTYTKSKGISHTYDEAVKAVSLAFSALVS